MGVPLSYRFENLIHNNGENVFLVVVFQIFVGAWAPASYYVASPLLKSSNQYQDFKKM
jgi:hypothetical protein